MRRRDPVVRLNPVSKYSESTTAHTDACRGCRYDLAVRFVGESNLSLSKGAGAAHADVAPVSLSRGVRCEVADAVGHGHAGEALSGVGIEIDEAQAHFAPEQAGASAPDRFGMQADPIAPVHQFHADCFLRGASALDAHAGGGEIEHPAEGTGNRLLANAAPVASVGAVSGANLGDVPLRIEDFFIEAVHLSGLIGVRAA